MDIQIRCGCLAAAGHFTKTMKRPCSFPGCSSLLDKSGYCERHKASAPKRHKIYDRHVRQRDPALAEAARIRSSPRWQRVRKQVLADQPMCQDPHGEHQRAGVTRTATQIHHIQGLTTRPDLAFERDNLMAVCNACHARLEREVRRNPPETPQTPPRASCDVWTPFG
jgi:5-methylcytosine-specific restriction protein A